MTKIENHNWQKYYNNEALTERERFDMVHMKAKQIEDKAKLEEKLLCLDDNNTIAIKKASEVNDLYIESIHAKLKLLNVD